MLVIIEDGFSTVSQVSYTEHKDNSNSQKLEAGVSTSATLLSKLLKIDLKGELSHSGNSGENESVAKEKVTCPLNLRYVFRLADELPKEISVRLLYPPYRPRWAENLKQEQSMISQIQQRNRLLFYLYDTVDPFLRLLNETAENPHVLSIKITIYRLASSSKIAQILCRAAENGKEVLVLMELRARFDEENNLTWSRMLEESGCQVIYGREGFECHSKICLIKLRAHNKTRETLINSCVSS